MEMGADPTPMSRRMETYASPYVLAYGIHSNLTLIARQIVFHRRMHMPEERIDATGYGDFRLVGKWRALRVNPSAYIFGIAPALGIDLPTGDDDFGSDTWDAVAGLYLTGRRGSLGADLNLEYALNGIEDRAGEDGRPGDELAANLALSYQLVLDEHATKSLWPVIELTYSKAQLDREGGNEVHDSGGHLLTIGLGLKFARQSFMMEILAQVPLDQERMGSQLARETYGLVGVRYLF